MRWCTQFLTGLNFQQWTEDKSLRFSQNCAYILSSRNTVNKFYHVDTWNRSLHNETTSAFVNLLKKTSLRFKRWLWSLTLCTIVCSCLFAKQKGEHKSGTEFAYNSKCLSAKVSANSLCLFPCGLFVSPASASTGPCLSPSRWRCDYLLGRKHREIKAHSANVPTGCES